MLKHLSVRIDADQLAKFRYICKYNGRSANGQLITYIRHTVEDFERKHGKIELEEYQN